MGGERVLQWAALDERVDLAVVSGYLTDRMYWWFEHPGELTPEHAQKALPAMFEMFDDRNYAALIHPRYLGVELGSGDPRSAHTLPVVADIRALYAASGHGDHVEFLDFDGGHETSVGTVLPFVRRWLASLDD